MINWREGKAGFVGAAKQLIKGFFQYQRSETSAFVAPLDSSIGLISIIQSRGQGVLSSITGNGQGVLSSIDESEGLISIIKSRGQGVSSPITSDGIGVESIV